MDRAVDRAGLRKKTQLEVSASTLGAMMEALASLASQEQNPEPPAVSPIDVDGFTALYDPKPTLKKKPPDRILGDTLRKAMNTSTYRETHRKTMLREDVSIALYPMLVQELQKVSEEVRKAQEELRQKQEQLEQLKAQSGGDPEAETQAEEAIRNLRRNLRRQQQQAQKQLLRTLQQIKKGAEAAEHLSSLGWGNEAGTFARAAAEGYLDHVLDAVRSVKDWFGRMKRAHALVKATSPRIAPPIKGVTVGGEISRALPSELSLLGTELEELFFIKVMEKKLLQYDISPGESQEGARGDIIVLVDESGSMSGEPLYFAKAFAFVLYSMAKEEGRKTHIISFSYYEGDMVELPEGAPAREAAEWLSRSIGGGTAWEPPMRRALEIIKENRLRSPDIIMLTDGECDWDYPDLAHEIKATGARVWGILFGGANEKAVRKFADKVLWATLNDEGLLEIFQELREVI